MTVATTGVVIPRGIGPWWPCPQTPARLVRERRSISRRQCKFKLSTGSGTAGR
jgi:hypothetical protein